MKRFFQEVAPVGFLFLLLLIFFAPVLFLGESFIGSGLIYSDLMTLNYPLKHLLAQSLSEGQLPFWTTLIGNGSPIFAESQIGALYPPHLVLFRFLPTVMAFNLNLFLHFLLAALGTYFLCRVSFKLSWSAGILAALAFSLSGFMITRIHQVNIILVVAWLPLVFLLIERVVIQKRFYLAFILGLVFVFQILAGYFEMFYYSLLAGGLFFILLLFLQKEKIRPVTLFSCSLILAVGISAPQILSTWEMTKYSVRSEGLSLESASTDTWPLNTFSFFLNPRAYDVYQPNPNYQPSDPTTVSLHDLYGYIGFLPFIFALVSIFFLFRKKPVLILILLLLLALLLSLGRSTQVFSIIWETVPGLKFFRFPTKWLFFIEFTLSILAAFGFEWVLGKMGKLVKLGPTSPRGAGLRGVKILGLLGVIVVFGDLYFNNLPLQPRVKNNFWFTDPPVMEIIKGGLNEGHFRLYSHGTNNIDYGTIKDLELQKEFLNILPPDTNIPFNLPSNREWYSLFLARQQKLSRLNTNLDPQTGILRLTPQMKKSLNLQGVKYLLSDLPFDDPDLVLVKDFPLKRESFHSAYLITSGEMKTVKIPITKTYVYQNKAVFPRAMWVERAKVLDSKTEEDILGTVLGKDFDPGKEVVLEEGLFCGGSCRSLPPSDVLAPLRVPPSNVAGTFDVPLDPAAAGLASPVAGKAIIRNYREQEVEIETEADRDGFLVLSDTYYPGWKATVDGNPTKIYRADFSFRAVGVPSGKHLVKFTFEPTYWRLGIGISLGTLMVVLLGLGWSLWKKV